MHGHARQRTLQRHRFKIAHHHADQVGNMGLFLQVIPYFTIAFGDMFNQLSIAAHGHSLGNIHHKLGALTNIWKVVAWKPIMISLCLTLRVNLRAISSAVRVRRRKSHSISWPRNGVRHFNHAGLVAWQWLGELHGQVLSVAIKFRRRAIQFHRYDLQTIGVQL